MSHRDEVIIRTSPQPADLNVNGNIFGGWVLSQMDIAGGVVASRIAEGAVATVAIEAMKFHAPIMPGDLISIYAHVNHIGTTSISITLEVIAERGKGEEIKVTEGTYIFVAVDTAGTPRPIPKP